MATNRNGFSRVVNIFLIAMACMLAITGVYLVERGSNSKVANNTISNGYSGRNSSSMATSQTSSPKYSTALVAIKTDCKNTVGYKDCGVIVNKSTDIYVWGTVTDKSSDDESDKYIAIAKKDSSGQWSVIWLGKSMPTQTDAKKYHLPAEWGPYSGA